MVIIFLIPKSSLSFVWARRKRERETTRLSFFFPSLSSLTSRSALSLSRSAQTKLSSKPISILRSTLVQFFFFPNERVTSPRLVVARAFNPNSAHPFVVSAGSNLLLPFPKRPLSLIPSLYLSDRFPTEEKKKKTPSRLLIS